VPDSKTAEGRRLVSMSHRVSELLRARCGTRSEGWVFPSNRAASGHLRSIDRLLQEARRRAGLPKELVRYCARPDYGTRVLMRTGNLAAVMKTMGRTYLRFSDGAYPIHTSSVSGQHSWSVSNALLLPILGIDLPLLTPTADHGRSSQCADLRSRGRAD
jgi:hypothetical protein